MEKLSEGSPLSASSPYTSGYIANQDDTIFAFDKDVYVTTHLVLVCTVVIKYLP